MRMMTLPTVMLLLVACEPSDDGRGCDEMAAASVTVSVYNQAGAAHAPDKVTYDVDGLGEVDCEALDTNATEFICGWEETGEFTVRVYDGADVYIEELTLELSFDGCHVQGQFVDVTVSG
jgi:hypothetical protein